MSSFFNIVTFIILVVNPPSFKVSSHKWIGTIWSERLHIFSPPSTSLSCFNDTALFASHFKKGALWAVKMLDSSANSLSGILNGNTHNFGNFDQCLSIKLDNLDLAGKYCLIKLRYWPNHDIYANFYNNITVYEEPNPLSSVWSDLQVTNDPRLQRRDIIYIGYCFPSSCSSLDLQQSLHNENYETFLKYGIHIEFSVTEDRCITEIGKEDDITFGTYIFIVFFGTMLIVVSISTGIHVYNEAVDKFRDEWYLPLSALHNVRQMKKPTSKDYAPTCGLKVLSMFIVIYGHRYLLSLYTPVINMHQNEKKFGKIWEIFILNGSIVVDTFFCTSAFISFQKMLLSSKKENSIPLSIYLVCRWIRITSVLIVTVLFMTFVLPAVSSGPMWTYESRKRSEVCLKYWWVNLLYISNYLHADKLCLIPAWYLASDMQLFILSLFLNYVYLKNRLCGRILLFTILLVAIILPGIIVYFGKFHGIFRFFIRDLKDYHFDKEYLNVYSSTLSRSSPYMIGMTAAYVHLKMKSCISIQFWVHVLLAFSTLFITTTCILSAWPLYDPGHIYNVWENVSYAVLSKVFWAVNMCWIIMANSMGGENLLSSKILSSKVFSVLNKLTLCVLLVHTPIQFIIIMSIRTPQYLTHFTVIWMASADIFLSYCVAFIVYLLIEAPVTGFLKKCVPA